MSKYLFSLYFFLFHEIIVQNVNKNSVTNVHCIFNFHFTSRKLLLTNCSMYHLATLYFYDLIGSDSGCGSFFFSLTRFVLYCVLCQIIAIIVSDLFVLYGHCNLGNKFFLLDCKCFARIRRIMQCELFKFYFCLKTESIMIIAR